MNLGERVNCGVLLASKIGRSDNRVKSIASKVVDSESYQKNGNALAYSDLAGLPEIDATVTENSTNLVSSGAVHTALDNVTTNASSVYAPKQSPLPPVSAFLLVPPLAPFAAFLHATLLPSS